MKFSSSAAAMLLVMASSTKAASAFQVAARSGARTRAQRRSRLLPFRSPPLAMVATSSTDTGTGTDVVSDNPMLDQKSLPRFSEIEPRHVTPAVGALLSRMESEFKSLEERLASSSSEAAVEYEKVLPEVEKIQEPVGYAWGIAGHLNGVKNGEELREAYEAAQPGVVQAMTSCGQSKPLYDALCALEEAFSAADQQLEGEGGVPSFEELQRRRAVSNSLRSMRLGGVGLEGEDKVRFNEIRLRLAELSTKFSNNVLDATKAFSLTIDDKAVMEKVPSSARAMWSQAYAMHVASEAGKEKEGKGDAEPDAENGPWRITLDGPSYVAAMQHLPHRDLRESIYRAYLTRASELMSEEDKSGEDDEKKDEDRNNVPLIYEILSLKKEAAALLGFDNYAEQSLASKMAPDVEAVGRLSDLIAEKALPAAKNELEEITALARARGGEEYSEANLDKLQPWDVTFWSERLREEKFDVTEEELRPYFALPAVLDGMFGLVKRLFGIEVRPADGEAEVWHEDVRFFNVYDEASGEHIASFYLDPYSRPANKRGGAWMDVCIGKSEACERKIPVAYLTCNGSPPVGKTPSLMTFREVETLFHEFGHGLQHMLTDATVGDVAGINGVEWDAVELPSQFMENWCYDKPTVYGFAKHYETGEPLPEELFEKLKEQKTFTAGLMATRQLYFGQLDLELHSTFDPKTAEEGEGGETIFDVQRRIAAKYSPHNMPLDIDRFLCTFNHIFGGGYAAGYYSYKWAEVMSADAFGAFEDVGLDNEEQVKQVGRKFRDTVLSLGGGVPPMDVFTRFRGREPSPDALLRHNGLA